MPFFQFFHQPSLKYFIENKRKKLMDDFLADITDDMIERTLKIS